MKKLEEMTSKELKALARREQVPNWWTLNKAKLIEGIKAKQAEAESAPTPTELTEEETEYVDHDVQVISEAFTELIEEPVEEAKKNTKAEPKRANKKLTELTYNGETKSIREWAEEINMPWPTLYDRVNRNGWSVEDAIEIPLGQRRPK